MRPTPLLIADVEVLRKKPDPGDERLLQVIAEVQADAQREPEAYLAETTVDDDGE